MAITHANRNPGQQGYSLVEAMVASLILGLVIIGVVSMLRTVRELEFGVHMNRKARIVAERELEERSYKDYSTYGLPTESFTAYPVTVLEDREVDPIVANITLAVFPEATFTWQGRTFSYRLVGATVAWPNPFDASPNVLSLNKVIANLP